MASDDASASDEPGRPMPSQRQLFLGTAVPTCAAFALVVGAGQASLEVNVAAAALLAVALAAAWLAARPIDRLKASIAELSGDRRRLDAELRQRSADLQRSETQFKAVVDHLPSGIILKDPEGGMLFVNTSALRWLGADSSFELLGARAEEVFAPDVAAQMADADRAAAAGAVTREREMSVAWPDGSTRTMLVSQFPVQTEAGDLLALGTVATDVSSIRAAEAEVRRSEAILRSILDQSPVSFSLKDPDRRFLMVNKVGAAWFGFDRDAMIGAGSDDINPADQVDMFAEADRRVLERREVARPFEYRDEMPFRPPMDLMVFKFPVWGAEDELIGIGTIQTDITERKRAEEELRRAYNIIRESVQYASKMQRTLLPDQADLALLGEHLMIWEPRDVVGGDIFWLRRTARGLLVIVGDGTGHGVPGAFITLVTTSALNQALQDHPDGDPAALLRHMNGYVKYMLRQDVEEGEADDGMELGVCLIEPESGRLTFAGARFSLFKVAGGAASEIRGDKGGIGYRRTPVDMTYTNHVLEHDPAAAYYLITDGIIDQVGGAKRRAFGKRRLLEKLVELRDTPLPAQHRPLMSTLDDFRGDEARRDDITVVGFRVARSAA